MVKDLKQFLSKFESHFHCKCTGRRFVNVEIVAHHVCRLRHSPSPVMSCHCVVTVVGSLGYLQRQPSPPMMRVNTGREAVLSRVPSIVGKFAAGQSRHGEIKSHQPHHWLISVKHGAALIVKIIPPIMEF